MMQPDNVYADSQNKASSKQRDVERMHIRWAWMADLSRDDRRHRVLNDVDRSSVRDGLLDVVRLLSSSTISTQTDEPSYTSTLGNMKMETDRHRSIASQAGVTKEKKSKAMQVVEADIVVSSQRHNAGWYSGKENKGATDHHHNGGELDVAATRAEEMLHLNQAEGTASFYRPTCELGVDAYPVYMSEARELGVANRYGYISLPQHVVPLPPRRLKKLVEPVDVPYLYGTHDLELADHVSGHLSRAHSLWTQSSGFVPKF